MTTGPAGGRGRAVPDEYDVGSRYLTWLAPFLGEDALLVERQLPFAVMFGLALLALLLPDVSISSHACVLASAVAVLATLALARLAPWGRWPEPAKDVLPLLQIVAVGLLRAGTGGVGSIFTSLVFLPVITLAARPGRRGVLLVATGVAGVILLPVVLDPNLALTSAIVVRGGFIALVAVVVAISVYETTDRLRARTEAVVALRDNEQRLLARMRADALELARVSANRKVMRDQLVSVIDSATQQAIIASDTDGLVEVFNAGAERMLGYAQGDVVGRMHVREFALPEEAEHRSSETGETDYDLYVASVASGHGAPMRDWTVVRADGSHVTARIAVTRRFDVDGEIVGYVLVATDVTEEREAEQLKDQFVSLISHELRTPLTSVLGYLELLQDGSEPLTDDQRDYLAIIERNARRQLRLVSDLLLSAQVDAGTFAVSPAPIDLAQVATASIAAATPGAASASVRLELDAVATPLAGDAGRIGQAVDNLVSNAVKFTPAGGVVRVAVAPADGGGGRLSVSDTGIGIPADELANLTTRFFRATNATRRAIPGVGLGLSIAKAVVDAHGGELTIDSTVGEGTTFTIDLPAAPPSA